MSQILRSRPFPPVADVSSTDMTTGPHPSSNKMATLVPMQRLKCGSRWLNKLARPKVVAQVSVPKGVGGPSPEDKPPASLPFSNASVHTNPEPLGILGAITQKLASIFKVFSDERCNSKLLALAIGQMLCSVATLIHDSYLPVYVHDELGLSTTEIGAVQGLAQFLCQLTKGVSGVAGDLLGSQVRVLVFGTFLTFLCKPMFSLLSTVYGTLGLTACLYWFFAAKLFDRLSKGIREAPTKAVMNELAKESGDAPDAAYGLRQSLATAGMLIGSTIASVTFMLTGSNYNLTFAVASGPPLIALIWLMQKFRDDVFGKRMPAAGPASATPEPIPSATLTETTTPRTSEAAVPSKLNIWQKAKALFFAFKPVYWQALLVVSALYFARFDASFLSLRAKQVLPKTALPMLTLMNSLIQVVLTAPLAKLSGNNVATRNKILLVGFAVMMVANVMFGLTVLSSPTAMFVGAALLGIHMALTHAITVSMVASYMPTGEVPGLGKLSGTAVSFTDLLLGFVLAASNTVAGILSDYTRRAGLGNTGCFAGGFAACAVASVLLLLFWRFGDLGKDELVVTKRKKAKAT